MADKEHLALIRPGVAVWNQWRQECPEKRQDLSRSNLSGANLSEADLSSANLRGTALSETIRSAFCRAERQQHARYALSDWGSLVLSHLVMVWGQKQSEATYEHEQIHQIRQGQQE
jgi:hypothetical protein